MAERSISPNDSAPAGKTVESNGAGAPRPLPAVVGRPFPKGVSGNPGGRRKADPDFVRRCGKLASAIRREMFQAIEERRIDDLPKLASAFEIVCDRANLLRGQDVATMELARAKLMVEVAQSELPPDQKQKVIDYLAAAQRNAQAQIVALGQEGDDE